MSVTVKITVAEPSVIIRSGIIAVIGSAENLKAEIYEVSEIDQLRNVLSWQHPDILLVNPASLGLFPLQQLKKDTGNPDMKCVALQFAFTDHAALKSYDDAISVYDSAETVNDKLARLVSEPERDKRHESLSGREKEVIACVVQGMTNKQIADKLFISTHTVITHRRNISAKLGIHSPAGLTIYAIVKKLVELDDIKDSVEEQLPGRLAIPAAGTAGLPLRVSAGGNGLPYPPPRTPPWLLSMPGNGARRYARRRPLRLPTVR